MKFSLFLIHFHCSFHCCSLCSLVAKLQAGSDCLLSLAVEKKLAGGLRQKGLDFRKAMGRHWHIVSRTEVSMWHCGTADAQGCGYQILCSFGVLFSPAWRALGKARLSHLPPASLGKSYRVPGTVSLSNMCWRALFPTGSN